MPTSIIFVDSRVADYQSLIDSFTEPAEVFVLDVASDGLAQMAAYLQGRTGIDAIHVISHGSQGALYLGSSVLDGSNLASYQSQLASIGGALTETGDILLYGCNVAQGDVGLQFINSLARYTEVDVAASIDATGAATLGGNWVLEQATGATETLSIASASFQALLLAETEPNNTRGTANAIPLNTLVVGLLSVYTDMDYYSVAATVAGTLSVVFDVPTNVTYSDYFKLGLYDSSGTLLSLFATGVDKTYSVGVAGAGTYYIGVTGNDYLSGLYYSSGQYSLTVSNIAGSTNGSESEGNDTRATADAVTLGTAITGQLSSSTDTDWFRTDIASPTVVSISIDVPTNSSYSDYFSVSIFNSSGTLLAKQATGTDRVFNFRATEAGSYYTVLSSPSYYYDSGNYSLTVSQGANTGAAYESESNSTRITANTLVAGTPIHGQLSSSADLDYYAINLTSAGKLHFALTLQPTAAIPTTSRFRWSITMALFSRVRHLAATWSWTSR
jgi:hypothetical protein